MITDIEAPAEFTGATVALRVPANSRKKQKVSNTQRRIHARAIKRIVDQETGELVGWLYEWNTGEVVPRWREDAKVDVIFD